MELELTIPDAAESPAISSPFAQEKMRSNRGVKSIEASLVSVEEFLSDAVFAAFAEKRAAWQIQAACRESLVSSGNTKGFSKHLFL